MFGSTFRQHFQVMGADVDVALYGEGFEIGIDQGQRGEMFRLRFPGDGSVTAKVLDADRYQRHLLLNVVHRGLGVSQKYLCGHDEFHWFVAALPEKSAATTVPQAMESLKPDAVRQEQRRKRVKRSRRHKRHTTAYLRQGEWFFVPRPDFDAAGQRVQENGSLVRGAGKPHRVESLCRSRGGGTYVRGRVSHPDHATIRLDVWHEVFRNTEREPAVMARPTRRAMGRPAQRAMGRAAQRAVFDMTYLD
ncbi:MAG TPA: hypothetical protein VHI52_22100 [Verrucomicrobiae bacterium]|nr:hypothetical protein [Verrucomicrobiae bacterium]HWB08179.1 hypothetical protein [Pirellulales bacterium]